MRNLFSFLPIAFLLVLSGCSNGKNTSANSISIEILGNEQPDSIKVVSFNNSEGLIAKSGNPYLFSFSKSISDAFVIDVYKNEKTYSKKLFLDGENLKVQAELMSEDLKIDSIIGSDTYNKSIAFYSNLDSLNRNKINDFEINKFLLASVKENLNHPFSFEISNQYLDRNKNYKSRLLDLKSILDEQSDTLKSHTLSVHRVLKDLVKNEYLELSKFEFYNRKGNVTKINRAQSGDYLLDFWFVQCPPCARDHKKIVKHLNLFSDNNVELIGVSIDTESDKWLTYLESHNYNWQNYRELGGDKDLINALDVWEFPTYILINPQGEIITKFYSFEEIQNYYIK